MTDSLCTIALLRPLGRSIKLSRIEDIPLSKSRLDALGTAKSGSIGLLLTQGLGHI